MEAFRKINSLYVRQGHEKILRTQFHRCLNGIGHGPFTCHSFFQAPELTRNRFHRIGIQGQKVVFHTSISIRAEMFWGEKSGDRIDGAFIFGDKMSPVM